MRPSDELANGHVQAHGTRGVAAGVEGHHVEPVAARAHPAREPQADDALQYSLNTLKMKHTDTSAKVETARRAVEESTKAQQDFQANFEAHVEQLKKTFSF